MKAPADAAVLQLPPKLLPVFTPPRGELRYRGAYGGRGSSKSYTFAEMAAVFAYAEPLRVLCTREFQVSIKESFHAELRRVIASEPWLAAHYDVGVDYLRGKNGTEFIFRGLQNKESIKSLSGIDLCVVEEGEDLSEESWLALEPTIRAPRSEIWVIWNPRIKGSPVDRRFRQTPPPRSAVVQVNWQDNPWFPEVLAEQRAHNRANWEDGLYAHIWEGAYLENSQAQVFAGRYEVRDFKPGDFWEGPYQGLDFGFSQDPTAGVRCWVYDNCLWIEYEAGRVGLELDHTPGLLRSEIPGFEKHKTRADNSRPESISHLCRHGLPLTVACSKGKGSVEDGIAHLKTYRRIYVHPRCVQTLRELRVYSYRVDRRTGEILTSLVDADNHFVDALRYALEPRSKGKGGWSAEAVAW